MGMDRQYTPEQVAAARAELQRRQAQRELVNRQNNHIENSNDWLSTIANIPGNTVKDLAVGLGTSAQNLFREDPVTKYLYENKKGIYSGNNAPTPIPRIDLAEKLGRKDAGLASSIVQGIGQYAPYLGVPEIAPEGIESGIAKLMSSEVPALRKIGAGSKILNDIPVVGKALKSGIGMMPGGAVFGGTQSDNPISGAVEGALTSAAGGAVLNPVARALRMGIIDPVMGKVFGQKQFGERSQQDLMNGILRMLRNQREIEGANTPAEVARDMRGKFTDQAGEPLPVDIGQVTNQPFMKSLYNILRYVPGSGMVPRRNQIRQAIINKEMSQAQQELAGVQPPKPSEYQPSAYEGATFEPQDFKSPYEQQLQDTHNQMSQHLDQANESKRMVDQATPSVNQLLNHLPKKNDVVGSVKKETAKKFKQDKAESDEMYQPVNESKIQLDEIAPASRFQNYGKVAGDLLAQRENLTNLFGSDSDLGSMLNGEITKAENLLNNKGEFAETLPEIVKRTKNLRRLSARAYDSGRFNESRLLNDLGESLHKDTLSVLNDAGHGDVADQLTAADANYKENMVPWFSNNVIKNTATNPDYIPSPNDLAKSLHNPNNARVFQKLSPGGKNTILNLRLTQGRLNTQGLTNMSPEEIAKAYSKLTQGERAAIESHQPQLAKYFENLNDHISNYKQSSDAADRLQKEYDRLSNKQQTKENQFMTQQARQESKAAADRRKYETKEERSKRQFEERQKAEEEAFKKALAKAQGRVRDVEDYATETPREASISESPKSIAANLALANALRYHMGIPGKMTGLLSLPIGGIGAALEKAMTSPELRNAYMLGTQIKSPQSTLAKKLTQSLLLSNTTSRND